MKIKQYLYITNPEGYLDGSVTCFTICGSDDVAGSKYTEDWILVGEIEVEVNMSDETIRQLMVGAIDAEEVRERAEFQVKLDKLKDRKDRLLAITHQPLSAA